MELNKIDKILKIAIFVAFLCLLIFMRVYKLDSCDLCKMEIDGSKVNQAQFMKLYYNECLKQYYIPANRDSMFNFTIINISKS